MKNGASQFRFPRLRHNQGAAYFADFLPQKYIPVSTWNSLFYWTGIILYCCFERFVFHLDLSSNPLCRRERRGRGRIGQVCMPGATSKPALGRTTTMTGISRAKGEREKEKALREITSRRDAGRLTEGERLNGLIRLSWNDRRSGLG